MPILTEEEVRERWLIRWELAKRDPWPFVKYFVQTLDEHDREHGMKPYPVKAVGRIMCRAWRDFDILFVEKSRQIMMTWTMAALILHDTLFTKGARRHFLQSKKQEDADAILDRVRVIYDSLSEMNLPGLPEVKKAGNKSGTTSEMRFPSKYSIITAIPQGPHTAHSYTCSGIFGDEINHQTEAKSGYEGALPTIKGGGKYFGVGTPNGHTFGWRTMYAIDERTDHVIGPHKIESSRVKENPLEPPSFLNLEGDDKVEAQRRWIEHRIITMPEDEFNEIPFVDLIASMPGMKYWRTCTDVDVLSIHYSADPDKSIQTAKGREWGKNERKGMPPAGWLRQYEINYETFEGRPVISNWRHHIFVKSPQYDEQLPLLLSFDFGKKCGCLFAQKHHIQEFTATQIQIIDEIYLQNSNTLELADRTLELLSARFYRSWETNNIRAYCDPAGHQERETTNDKSLNSSVKILRAKGIFPTSHMFGVPESTQQVETVFAMLYPNSQTAITIHEKCEYLISCLSGGWHYPENGRPGYPEKDSVYEHGGDMLRYLICNVFTAFDMTRQQRPRQKKNIVLREKNTGRIVGYRKPRTFRRGRKHASYA